MKSLVVFLLCGIWCYCTEAQDTLRLMQRYDDAYAQIKADYNQSLLDGIDAVLSGLQLADRYQQHLDGLEKDLREQGYMPGQLASLPLWDHLWSDHRVVLDSAVLSIRNCEQELLLMSQVYMQDYRNNLARILLRSDTIQGYDDTIIRDAIRLELELELARKEHKDYQDYFARWEERYAHLITSLQYEVRELDRSLYRVVGALKAYKLQTTEQVIRSSILPE